MLYIVFMFRPLLYVMLDVLLSAVAIIVFLFGSYVTSVFCPLLHIMCALECRHSLRLFNACAATNIMGRWNCCY